MISSTQVSKTREWWGSCLLAALSACGPFPETTSLSHLHSTPPFTASALPCLPPRPIKRLIRRMREVPSGIHSSGYPKWSYSECLMRTRKRRASRSAPSFEFVRAKWSWRACALSSCWIGWDEMGCNFDRRDEWAISVQHRAASLEEYSKNEGEWGEWKKENTRSPQEW